MTKTDTWISGHLLAHQHGVVDVGCHTYAFDVGGTSAPTSRIYT